MNEKDLSAVFSLLNKAFRAYKIYPKGHEIPRFFLRQLWENIKDPILKTTKIDFIFDNGKVLSEEGNNIWMEDENDDNLAWVLYKNGVRGISFKNTISLADFQNFLEAIQNAFASSDKFALIYELNVRDYSGLSIDFIPEYIQDQNVFIPETYQDIIKLREQEPKSEPLEIEGSISSAIEIPIIIESREVFTISPEEEQMLNEEIAKERESLHFEQILKHLFSIFELSSSEESSTIIKSIEEFILLEIFDSGLSVAAKILHDLTTLKLNLDDRVKIKQIDELIKNISETSLLETLINKYIESKPKELEQFLAFTSPQSALNIFQIASELTNKSQRAILLRGILKMHNLDSSKVLNFIQKHKNNEKILITGLEFISYGKFTDMKDFLNNLLLAGDNKIKNHLLEAISSIEGDLTPFFYDEDPNVRIQTYLEMKKNPKKSHVSLILERLKSDSLYYKMDIIEKKQFMSLIPHYIDYTTLEDAVKEILIQNLSIFDRITKARKFYETVQFLINSLVESNKKKIYLLLIEAVKHSKDQKIRAMCSEALKQFKE